MNDNKPKVNMKTVRWVEIVSRLTSDDGTTLFDMDNAMEVIQQKEKAIDEYCYIIHDRDVYEEDTDTHKKGDLKPPHVHLLLKFKKKQPQKLGIRLSVPGPCQCPWQVPVCHSGCFRKL